MIERKHLMLFPICVYEIDLHYLWKERWQESMEAWMTLNKELKKYTAYTET